MRILRLPTLAPRARRAAVPLTVLAAAVLAAGTGSAAAGHRVAESATYVNTVTSKANGENSADTATSSLTPFTILSPDVADGGR
ncbi:MAG TPA: hypothetical protein VH372_16420, partial [Actinospica sp.]|nr:hypothetical protein [Actinospica sp.]